MRDADTEAWLRGMPVGAPVTIDGVEVWLKPFPLGAELMAVLVDGFSEADLQNTLMQGFQAALEFDAGFGLSPDGRSLVLSQWLPDVGSWVEAADALERLLDQVEMVRGGASRESDPMLERDEQRMRRMLEGGIR